MFCNVVGDDRNFALESYGVGSKCFDHTERMWEERSCSQVRQWQHWGSGCYNYICEEQRLHMQVLNHTFTCFYPGQEIEVKLVDNLEELWKFCKPSLLFTSSTIELDSGTEWHLEAESW